MLLRCHAGAVLAMGVCPFASYIATLGEDGRLHIYDCNVGRLIAYRNFPAKGRQLIWLPISVNFYKFFLGNQCETLEIILQADPSGSVLIMGCDDETIKVVVVSIQTNQIKLIQVLKPHCMEITVLSINSRETILLSGSKDSTIFINHISLDEPFIVLQPIGFVEMPSAVSAINWKPNMVTHTFV